MSAASPDDAGAASRLPKGRTSNTQLSSLEEIIIWLSSSVLWIHGLQFSMMNR